MKTVKSGLMVIPCMMMVLIQAPATENGTIDGDLLRQDVRKLIDILEHVHPDPYIQGGGKIAFHRRFQEVLASIPAEGMGIEEFHWLLTPFMAILGDAHTFLFPPETEGEGKAGIPLVFGCIDESLYVRQVYNRELGDLLGSKIISIAGVPFEELLRRFSRLKGTRNKYNLIDNLRLMLWTQGALKRLIPEWEDNDSIHLELQGADGQVKEQEFKIPGERGSTVYVASSKIMKPSRRGCEFAYQFMDDDKQAALLVINNMVNYREALERRDLLGLSPEANDERARRTYRNYHQREPPEDYLDVRAGLPSATDCFLSLVKEMKGAGTRLLIVDLRDNGGGSSAMSKILVYFLYGKECAITLDTGGGEALKYSKYYFETHDKVTLEKLNEERDVPLTVNDYDFTGHLQPGFKQDESQIREEQERRFLVSAESMPTFHKVYMQNKYDAYYCPERVVVLCNAGTFSAAFTMLNHLHLAGAVVVGTPSGQAGHCFGAAMHFALDHSGLRGLVSQKFFSSTLLDAESARVFMPDHILTYEKFASYQFDSNAELLYALELFNSV